MFSLLSKEVFMKIFSFFIAILLFVCSFIYFPTISVRAQYNYLRVITEDTPFYKSVSDTNPIFFLPYTYYVKVISQSSDFTYVEVYGLGGIPAIDGYVPTHYLYEDGLSVENPFVVQTLTTTDTAILYADQTTSTHLQYLFSNRQLSFYGTVPTANGNLYFVGYNGRLGYVKESSVYPFSIPNHPNELTFIKPEIPEEDFQSTPETYFNSDYLGFKLAIIGCLIFAGIIGLFIALKAKPQKNVAVSFYDENDYE